MVLYVQPILVPHLTYALLRSLAVIDDDNSDYLYLVQELCEGGEVMSSSEVLNQPLPEPIARKYLREMILGIEFCHRHGIIHRDIKPENVLLSSDGKI